MEFDEAQGHHAQVRHHAVAALARVAGEEDLERFHKVAQVGRHAMAGHQLVVGLGGGLVPLPSVFKGTSLGGAGLPRVGFEEDVVVGLGVEGRIEIDEVYGLVGDVFS